VSFTALVLMVGLQLAEITAGNAASSVVPAHFAS
jgi:hypothetical protein